jgi:hypothetical protein
MNDAVWLGLIVAAGPIVTIVVNRWSSTKDKKIQFAREDLLEERTKQVAEQAARAAKLLLQHDAQAAAIAKASSQVVSAKLQELSKGQDRIHVLVNSNLQAALEAQAVALKGWLASVKSVDGDPSLIEELTRRVQEIDSTLSDRVKATIVAEAEVKNPKTTGE